MWFNNRDLFNDGKMNNMYGLLRADGTKRPVYSAFQDYARFGDRLTGPCGDFGAPTVQILSPTPGTIIGDHDPLPIVATSTDKDVLRMTLAIKGAPNEIRNFTNHSQPLNLTNGVGLTWQGVKSLPNGEHTLVVTAVDSQGNVGSAEATFRKVDPRTLPRQRTSVPKLRLLGRKGRTRTITGQVKCKLPFNIYGKVYAQWQTKRKVGKKLRWKKVHGAAANANKAFKFRQRLKYRGKWRVRVVYKGKRPFRSSHSKWKYFKVK
jgi:hypothetical protein